jgi:hypothetical protein
MEYRVYNTGDQIWISQRFGKEVTVKVVTHDGIIWSEGDDSLPIWKLTGMEKHLHKVEVFFIKLILKALS